MSKAILLRHGQSTWNKSNQFTGWTDVDLTEQGVREAHEGGRLLREAGIVCDEAFVSVLTRATRTLDIVLEEMGQTDIPVTKSWFLNERHYGALQGFYKHETAEKYGEEQVFVWRRSYDVPPPALESDDERHPANDPLYKDVPVEELPSSESLADVVARVIPYWEEHIVPKLKEGKTIIVAAHGNTVRALVKYLDDISDEDINGYDIPYAVPLVYEFDNEMNVLGSKYLGDDEKIKATMAEIKNQGKAK